MASHGAFLNLTSFFFFLQIFSWVDSLTLCRCARVCHRWSSLAWEPALWRSVRLRGAGVSGDRAVRGVLRRLGGCGSTIQQLQVTDGATLTDRGLTQLARRCPGLQQLQLHHCQQLGDAALAEIAARCSSLHRLDLTGNRLNQKNNFKKMKINQIYDLREYCVTVSIVETRLETERKSVT